MSDNRRRGRYANRTFLSRSTFRLSIIQRSALICFRGYSVALRRAAPRETRGRNVSKVAIDRRSSGPRFSCRRAATPLFARPDYDDYGFRANVRPCESEPLVDRPGRSHASIPDEGVYHARLNVAPSPANTADYRRDMQNTPFPERPNHRFRALLFHLPNIDSYRVSVRFATP